MSRANEAEEKEKVRTMKARQYLVATEIAAALLEKCLIEAADIFDVKDTIVSGLAWGTDDVGGLVDSFQLSADGKENEVREIVATIRDKDAAIFRFAIEKSEDKGMFVELTFHETLTEAANAAIDWVKDVPFHSAEIRERAGQSVVKKYWCNAAGAVESFSLP